MNILDFKEQAAATQFQEYPEVNTGTELVCRLLNYDEADSELKLYCAKLIFKRSFYGTYTAWYDDVAWFIRNFFQEYEGDKIKPWLSPAIREAAAMILSQESFTKGIIATSFMFGVLEFYAKHHLGFRPQQFDFFDQRKKNYVRRYEAKKQDLAIKAAFQYLQKTQLPIAAALNEIDTFTTARLTAKGIPSKKFSPHRIADRLNLPRNPMLHGETHSFYQTGLYLIMLYILFDLT